MLTLFLSINIFLFENLYRDLWLYKPPIVVHSLEQFIFIALEVLDPTETSVFMDERCYKENWDEMVKRYIKYSDCPRLWMKSLFPNKKICEDVIIYNQNYIKRMRQLYYLYEIQQIKDVIEEACKLNEMWRHIANVNSELLPIWLRREELKKAIDMLNNNPHYILDDGTILYVPLWRFAYAR